MKPSKKKSREKIDGAVATIMAVSRAAARESNESVYGKRGMLVIDPSHPDGFYYGGDSKPKGDFYPS